MNESLTKAKDCAQFAAEELRAALTGAEKVTIGNCDATITDPPYGVSLTPTFGG